MKKIKSFALASVAAILLASCGNRQMVSSQDPTTTTQSNPLGTKIELPCVDASMDDDEYFRALGTSHAINMQSARENALSSAQQMIRLRLGGFVQGFVSGYGGTTAGQTATDKVQRHLQNQMDVLVEKMINDAQKVCEELYQDGTDGNYNAFIAIQIPKGKLVDEMADILSKDEELEIEFNEAQFREYARKRMEEMKKDAEEKGYR